MDFNSLLFSYVNTDEITEKTIIDCFNCIVEMENRYNGFTGPQLICIKAYLKTMRKRTPKDLLDKFDDVLTPIINLQLGGKK